MKTTKSSVVFENNHFIFNGEKYLYSDVQYITHNYTTTKYIPTNQNYNDMDYQIFLNSGKKLRQTISGSMVLKEALTLSMLNNKKIVDDIFHELFIFLKLTSNFRLKKYLDFIENTGRYPLSNPIFRKIISLTPQGDIFEDDIYFGNMYKNHKDFAEIWFYSNGLEISFERGKFLSKRKKGTKFVSDIDIRKYIQLFRLNITEQDGEWFKSIVNNSGLNTPSISDLFINSLRKYQGNIKRRQSSAIPASTESTTAIVACPSCGARLRIVEGKIGIITCPTCRQRANVQQNGVVSEVLSASNSGFQDTTPPSSGLANGTPSAAQRQKQKVDVADQSNLERTDTADTLESPSDKFGARLAWLKDSAEVFERRRASGRSLSDYEQRVIEQYHALLNEQKSSQNNKNQNKNSTASEKTEHKKFLEDQWNQEVNKDDRLGSMASKPVLVVALGGGACELVDTLEKSSLEAVDWVMVDQNFEGVSETSCSIKLTIAPGKPTTSKINRLLGFSKNRTDVIFLCRLGGDFGSRMVQEVARGLKGDVGSTRHLIVTLPFKFEGDERNKVAEEVLDEAKEEFENILVLNNQDLLVSTEEKTSLSDAVKITSTQIENYIRDLL